MAGASQTMAGWISGRRPGWSPTAIGGAKRAVLDTLAVMLAGRDEPATQAVRRAAAQWGTGNAWCVLGGPLPPQSAAMVNGTAAHALDWDDVLDPALNHPSAALVPAVLALAGEMGLSGAACIDGYLTGFEIMARLGEAMNVVHYHRGWHTTLSLGATGVAAACARMLGLDARGTRMAIGLSVSMAGGSKRQFGSMAKPLHAGLAARNGMMAAQLAAAGVTAADEAFEGEWGYLAMTSGPGAPGLSAPLAKLGQTSAMDEYGAWAKLYPCCASTHRPVDALRAMAAEQPFAAADLAWADCHVSEVASANLRFPDPTDPDQARFSLQYCMAAALVDGTLTTASFHPEQLARKAVRALLPAIRMHVDPARSAAAGGKDYREGARVTLRLKDGRVFERSVEIPRGHPRDPASDAELEAKFRLGSHAALDRDGADAVIEAIGSLHRLDSIHPLLTALGGPPRC